MENRLTIIRAELKMSQSDLAKMAGISRATLSAIESGKYVPSFQTLAKLVQATKKPANEIFFDLDVVNTQQR